MVETDFYSLLTSPDGFGSGGFGDGGFGDTNPSAIAQIAACRVYPIVLPNGVKLPAISYLFVGGSSELTTDTQGSQIYRVEVNCWGTTAIEAWTLRDAVRQHINTYSGPNLYVRFLQNTDFFEHDLLQYRAMSEYYLHSNFTP